LTVLPFLFEFHHLLDLLLQYQNLLFATR
jgi:hypothetical protein